jgi:polyhydroxyalkanoate synthesis regulator phasin
LKAILGANLVDPETNEVFVQEVFRDVPSKEDNYKKAAEMMGVQLNSIYKERYKDKISALVSSGKISESYAQEALYPLVDAVQMSFKDGVPEKNHLDLTLQALEALPDLPTNTQTGRVSTAEFMSQKAPTSASKVENPLTNEGLVTDDEAAEIASAILKNTAGY